LLLLLVNFDPFLIDDHILVLSLALQKPFLEVVGAQGIRMKFVASDVVTLRKGMR
jgi:hypothetical protein